MPAFRRSAQGETGVRSNRFPIIGHGQSLLLDPGGDLTCTPLSLELSKRIPLRELA